MFHVPMSTRIRNIRIFYQSLIAFKIWPLLFNLQTFDGFNVLTFCQVSTWYPQRIANQLLGGKNSEHLHGLGPMVLSLNHYPCLTSLFWTFLNSGFQNSLHAATGIKQYTVNGNTRAISTIKSCPAQIPETQKEDEGGQWFVLLIFKWMLWVAHGPCSWLTTTASNDFSCWSPRPVQSNEFKGVQHLHHVGFYYAAPIRSLLAPLVPTWSCIQWHPQWPRRQNDTRTGGECKGYKVTAP